MSKPDVFMPLMIGDFLRDTMRLDTEQQGAYLLLLINMWCNGPIKNDEKILQKICKFSAHKWAKKSQEILQIFSVENGFITHRDLLQEKAKAIALQRSLSERNTAAIHKRWKRDVSPTNNISDTRSEADEYNSHSHSQNTNNSLSRAEDFIAPEDAAPALGESEAVAEFDSQDSSPSPAQAQTTAQVQPAAGASHEAMIVVTLLATPFDITIDPYTVQSWLDMGFNPLRTDDLGRIARQRKPTGPIPAKYLETIIRGELLASRPTTESRYAAKRSRHAEKLSPADIVRAACLAEAEAGVFEGECINVH